MSDRGDLRRLRRLFGPVVAQEPCPAENLIRDTDGSLWHLTCILEDGHGGEHYGRPLSWGYEDQEDAE